MNNLKKRLEETRQQVWSFLMNNIDAPNWATLKRLHNRLTDDLEKLEKLEKMHDENEYAFEDMRENRRKAIKALRAIKKARKSKKYSLIKTDRRTWKEIEVKTN